MFLFVVSCAPGEKAIAGRAIEAAGGTVLTLKAIIGVNGNGFVGNTWSPYGCTNHYECVDEMRSQSNASLSDPSFYYSVNYADYLSVSTASKAEAFKFDDLPVNYAGITVHNVTIKYVASPNNINRVFRPFLTVSGSSIKSTYIVLKEGGWDVYSSSTYLINPYSKLPWKVTDLNPLEAGMLTATINATHLGGGKVAAVWLEVYYSHLCGDALVQGSEQCDDGNAVDTDGCTNKCQFPAADLVVDSAAFSVVPNATTGKNNLRYTATIKNIGFKANQNFYASTTLYDNSSAYPKYVNSSFKKPGELQPGSSVTISESFLTGPSFNICSGKNYIGVTHSTMGETNYLHNGKTLMVTC